MNCIKCGKTFASHTARSEICWDCYMKDINGYQATNDLHNSSITKIANLMKDNWIDLRTLVE